MTSALNLEHLSPISSRESRQIECVRVLCISAMMWVHVTPGLSSASFVSVGDFKFVGDFLGQTLGRISVALLSFVSGYLFWLKARDQPIMRILIKRVGALYLPVLVWSAVFLALASGREILLGQPSSALGRVGDTPMALINAWTGLTGPMANLSLLFVRDMIVSTVLLRLLVPAIKRAPLLVAITTVALSLPQATFAPLIFRVGILQFMLLGALTARCAVPLSTLSKPAISLSAGFGLILGSVVAGWLPHHQFALQFDPVPLIRRAGIGFFALALTGAFLETAFAHWLARFGRYSFLAYLMHVPLLGVIWAVWHRLIGNEFVPSYALFFILSPVLVFGLAQRLGRFLDRAPSGISRMLRGPARVTPALSSQR
jgi:hypothetical protein